MNNRPKYKDVAGAILSGGKNSRMNGRNKALLDINGRPIIDRTILLFREMFEEVMIVTNSPEDYGVYSKDCCLVMDIKKNIGPLGGIHAALSQATKNAVFFVACDMPNLHNEMIVRQIDYFKQSNCDVLVPRIGDSIEPLHSIYRKSLKDDLYEFINFQFDYSIQSFLQTINISHWDLEDTSFCKTIFKNLNTPEDFRSQEKQMKVKTKI